MLSALAAVTAYVYYERVYIAENEYSGSPSIFKSQSESVSGVEKRTMVIQDDGTSVIVPEQDARTADGAKGLEAPSGSANTLTLQYSKESEEALKALQSGDYERAASLFKEVAKTDKRAYLGLGIAYFRMKNYREAENFLESSVEVEDSFLARKLLAYVYYYDNRIDKSLESASAALSIKEDEELSEFKSKIESEEKTQRDFQSDNAVHFKVIYDGNSHGAMSYKVIDMLESAYSDIGSEIYHFPSERITVILYAEKEFFDVTRMPDWAGGLYDGKIRLPIKDASVPAETLRNVIYHEYTHALVTDLAPKAPTWIQEGLAQHFSFKGQIIGQSIPLNKLETPFKDLPQKDVGTAYDESYSAAKYLIDKQGLIGFKHLLQSLGEGKTLDEAFDTAFYISYDEFVSTWGKQ